MWEITPGTSEFPSQRPVSFDAFFDLHLNEQLSKQWRHRWCHCAHYGVTTMFSHLFPPTPNLPQSQSCHLLPASSHPVSACHCVNCQYLGNPSLWGSVGCCIGWALMYHSAEHWIQGILYLNGLVQLRRNSIANALELRLSCTNPSICSITRSGLPQTTPVEIPWHFPDICPFPEFRWWFLKFPDHSLTLKNNFFPDFSLTCGNPEESYI